MIIYAFIFCRSGSKGLPNKNIKKILNQAIRYKVKDVIVEDKKVNKILLRMFNVERWKEIFSLFKRINLETPTTTRLQKRE